MALHIGIRQIRPGCWRLRYQGRNYRERSITVHGTEADAKREAAKWAAELEASGAGAVTQKATLGAVIRKALQFGQRRAASTIARYERYLRLYIEPAEPETAEERAAWRRVWGEASYGFAIGRKEVGRITAQDGMDFQHSLSNRFANLLLADKGNNAGAVTIQECMRICSSALDFAVRHGAIRVNPWNGLPRIKPRPPEIHILTRDRDLAAMLATADAVGGRVGLLIQLAWASGARRGELLALRWSDIDLETGELAIAASLAEINGEVVRKTTKTRAGRRQIILPLTMVHKLRTWRAEQLEHALANGWAAGFDRSPVFADERGNDWTPATASQAVRRTLHDAGLAVSLHSIRHSHGSKLLSSQLSPKAAADRLGHANVTTLLRYYGHTMQGDATKAAAVIDRVMTSTKPRVAVAKPRERKVAAARRPKAIDDIARAIAFLFAVGVAIGCVCVKHEAIAANALIELSGAASFYEETVLGCPIENHEQVI